MAQGCMREPVVHRMHTVSQEERSLVEEQCSPVEEHILEPWQCRPEQEGGQGCRGSQWRGKDQEPMRQSRPEERRRGTAQSTA